MNNNNDGAEPESVYLLVFDNKLVQSLGIETTTCKITSVMMWRTILPNSSSCWEPIELRVLKQKLANLTCECSICEKTKYLNRQQSYHDKEVQAEEFSFDQFTQVSPNPICTEKVMNNGFARDVFCPSCFVTMNLLRGGVTKVLKDEENETKAEMFSCDKGIGNSTRCIEKTTSITSKPKPKYSNLTLCDFISECSSDITVPDRDRNKSDHGKVKFVSFENDEVEQRKLSVYGDCLCLENFIDSIRPPM